LLNHIQQFYFTFLQENVHPLQGGYFRRKLRRQRRAGLIAVGMPIAGHPPHGSGRAQFEHPAPTLGV
jgi:hypothetical protein